MKQRWIFQSRISKTSHHRPAAHSGTPARHGPSWCSPWLVPSQTTVSLPEKTQLNSAGARRGRYSAPMTWKSWLTNTWWGQLTPMVWTS
jgi:hypothetical protein